MAEHKIRLSYLIFIILLYSCGFLAFTYQQMPNYFKKDLISYDESTNAVVSSNIYRERFPPKLRINSVTEKYQGWKEGPHWQHIPPLFSYIPYPVYVLDGKISIEGRRLSYVLVAYLQGIIFLIGIGYLYKEKRAILAAIITSWLWMLTPFVRGLLNGNYFGYSDVVLAFFITASVLFIMALSLRLSRDVPVSRDFLWLTIMAATMPILAKNVLGALPLAILWYLIIVHVRKNKLEWIDLAVAILLPVITISIYFGICYAASPEAFKAEILTPFQHFGNYEGWKKPWHTFITDYLPNRYFGFMWWPFLAAFIGTTYAWYKSKEATKQWLTGCFLIYFLINLLVVSIVTSKSANFILQGYLFLLFFVIYVLINISVRAIPALDFSKLIARLYEARLPIGIITFSIFIGAIFLNIEKMKELRSSPYEYRSQNEMFFQFGELCDQVLYANTRTLFILDSDTSSYDPEESYLDPDYWLRYYILFNTGSEARTIEEMRAFRNEMNLTRRIAAKYDRIYLVASRKTLNTRYSQGFEDFQKLGKFEVTRLKKVDINYLLNL